MVQTISRRGQKPGTRARRPVKADAPRTIKRSYSVDAEVHAVILHLAQRLGWSESWVCNVLLNLALLPYRENEGIDEAAVARRLVGLELERIEAQEG